MKLKSLTRMDRNHQTLVLPQETILKYLQNIPDFAIDPAPPSTKVSREMLNLHYGTHKWNFLTKITNTSSSLPQNDYRVICATAESTPYIPQGSGCSGLLFSCRQEITEVSPWDLFSRIRVGEWEYTGKYECFPVGFLTPEEFCSQRDEVILV
jgi:hypothetical protein